MIIGVGSNKSFEVYWQSAELPSPTILSASQKRGEGGWILEIENEIIQKIIHDTSGQFSIGDITNRPCNSITTCPNHWHVYTDIELCRTITIKILEGLGTYYLEDTEKGIMIRDSNKPKYIIPSMNDIEALPWNGYNVVSTFSGAGGSCLGYRMAGYRVLWANEFNSVAQTVYKDNHPNSILNTKDIRGIQGKDVLDSIDLDIGDIDIFDGSPPCDSFSTAGKRDKGWGKEKKYGDGGKIQRTDDLFFEYTRLVNELQPKVFIAENVSGMVKGRSKGYFLRILRALKECGYTVKAKLLDAQWLGVPQARQRIIFCGVRNDLVEKYSVKPEFPSPLPYNYSVKEAIPWIIKVERGRGFGNMDTVSAKQYPYQTVGSSPSAGNGKATKIETETEKRKFTIDELKRICSFPDDFQLNGTYAQNWARLGLSVPPIMMKYIAATVQKEILDTCKN